MGVSKKQFIKYVDTAATLAESLKRDIQKDGLITNKTVLALNEFIIASNELVDLTDSIRDPNTKLN